jgi:hypothetical protein
LGTVKIPAFIRRLVDLTTSWLNTVVLWYIRSRFTMERSTMSTHKFHIGQVVQLIPSISRNVPGGSYEITKKLPERDGESEYRIKSMNEPHERVARESELQGV